MSSLKSPQNFTQFYSIQCPDKANLQKPLESEHKSTEYAVREFHSDDTERQEDVLDRENELNSTLPIRIANKHEESCTSAKSKKSTGKHQQSRNQSNQLLGFQSQSFRLRYSRSASKCSRNKNMALTGTGASVFKSKGGIGAESTPVSKRFAPHYATTHSLVANTINYSAEKTLQEQKQDIMKLAPSNQ